MEEKMLEDAFTMALDAHSGQKDKAGKPYFGHPWRVSREFADYPLMQSMAILHDVVEDTHITLNDIRNSFGEFGEEIARVVDILTRKEGESYSDFINRCGADSIARRIKLADLKDNLRPNPEPEKKISHQARQEKYVTAIEILIEKAEEEGDKEELDFIKGMKINNAVRRVQKNIKELEKREKV